jgi:hypothetical protein
MFNLPPPSEEAQVKLKIDADVVDLADDKPLTLMFHDGSLNIRPYDGDVAMIDPAFTLWTADQVVKNGEWEQARDNPSFVRLWRLVWGDIDPPMKLELSNEGMRHTAGLILGCIGALLNHRRVFIKLPETYLHPKQQGGLADMLLALTEHGRPSRG